MILWNANTVNHGIIPQRACFFCITELYKALNSLFLLQSDQDIPICFDDLDSYFEAPILFPFRLLSSSLCSAYLSSSTFFAFCLSSPYFSLSPFIHLSSLHLSFLSSPTCFSFFPNFSCFLLFLSSLSLHSASSFFQPCPRCWSLNKAICI